MVTGTTLLVGLKSQSLGVPLGLVAEAPDEPAEPDVPTGDTPGSTAGPTAVAGTTPAPGSSVTATTPGQPTTPSQATTTTAQVPVINGTFAGRAVAVVTAQSPNTRSSPCGDSHDYSMSITITVSSGRITAATVAYSPAPGESQRYADKAANGLKPKVLTAQTWRLGNVSGATYSANAFELSLKDAMASAGLPT
jgi:uncharacterized protein with FMN-binding domain